MKTLLLTLLCAASLAAADAPKPAPGIAYGTNVVPVADKIRQAADDLKETRTLYAQKAADYEHLTTDAQKGLARDMAALNTATDAIAKRLKAACEENKQVIGEVKRDHDGLGYTVTGCIDKPKEDKSKEDKPKEDKPKEDTSKTPAPKK